MASDEPLSYKSIPITGRLITSVDPTQLGEGDFQRLQNMRYTDAGILSVTGQTKANATAFTGTSTFPSAYQFITANPASSHLLVQRKTASGGGSSAVYDSKTTTEVPGSNAFSSVVTETYATVQSGRFSPAPDGCVSYANGNDLLVWGGEESRCASFIVADKDDSNSSNVPTKVYDYTSKITNTLTAQVATISQRYVHIASTRAIKAIKFYVATANTAAVALTAGYYWKSNGTWSSLSSISDGTASGGKTLAQTGTISFTSTVSSAQLRYFNGQLAYWYLFDFNGIDATTTIYFTTVDAPFQQITDIWDGVPRSIASFQWHVNLTGLYGDYSTNVFSTDYVDSATSTYVDIHTLVTADYFVIGFTERAQGILFNFKIPNGGPAWTSASVSYWNGLGWTAVDGLRDGTNGFTTTGGAIYWTSPSSSLEFKTNISSPDQFYYYKISFTVTAPTGNNVYLDSVFGISAPIGIDTYRLPAMFQNRLALCNNQQDEQNAVLIGGANTSSVFNGSDSTKLYFGENTPIVAAQRFFSRFSNAFFENLVVWKADSTWIVDGTSPTDYKVFNISNMYGCNAPSTITQCDIGTAGATGGPSRNIIIWQSVGAICIWDGSVIFPISFDIKDIFDQTNSYAIDLTDAANSQAFYDETNHEWHWIFTTKDSGGAKLNKELAYDVVRKKWFFINRGVGKNIFIGLPIIDSSQNKYTYGISSDGYVQTLESGNTFDGNDIVSIFKTGDIPLGGWMQLTSIRHVRPIMKKKSTTTNQMVLTYYGDSATTVTNTVNFNVNDTTHRIVQTQNNKPNVDSWHKGDFTFHSFQCSMTTNNEPIGFEPIGIAVSYKKIREVVK